MALTNHKDDVSTMGWCVRKHIIVVHQQVVHITKHLSDDEGCTPHAHHIVIHFNTHTHTHKRMTQVHNIPKCDVSGMVVVVVERLVDVVPCCGVAEWDGASSSLVDQVSTHPNR